VLSRTCKKERSCKSKTWMFAQRAVRQLADEEQIFFK